MFWTIVAILFVIWLIGFLLHIGGAFLNLLLVVAAAVLLVRLLTRPRTTQ